MFSRTCWPKIRAMEVALGLESETRRKDHASSGPCDKGALVTTRLSQELIEPINSEQEILYTIIAPLGTTEVSYEV